MRLPTGVSILTTVILASRAVSVSSWTSTPHHGIADTLFLRSSSSSSSAAPFLARAPFQSAILPRARTRPFHVQSARAVELDDSLVELKSSSNLSEEDNLIRETFEEPVALVSSDNTNVMAMDMDMQEMMQKLINAIFLAVGFGWAAYTIFNIDAGMTRGWSQAEIAMRIPLDNWGNYEASLAEKPVFTKTLINVIIYLLGDWLSQTVFQKKNVLDFDISRTLKNGFIGLCFGPLVHQYYQFSDTILPVEGGIMNRVQKIFMDQTIYLTVKCAIYITAVGLLRGDDIDTCKQTVKDKIGNIVITAWKFWPLVHCVTYGFIPARHRILWVNCVDLVWNAILASKAQKDQPEETLVEEVEEALDETIKESAGVFLHAFNATDSLKEVDALEVTIKESAEAVFHALNATDPLDVVVEHANSLAEVKDVAEHHSTSTDEPVVVQEVRLTGMSIEIPADGVPVLVGTDEDETRLPIITTATTSADESSTVTP